MVHTETPHPDGAHWNARVCGRRSNVPYLRLLSIRDRPGDVRRWWTYGPLLSWWRRPFAVDRSSIHNPPLTVPVIPSSGSKYTFRYMRSRLRPVYDEDETPEATARSVVSAHHAIAVFDQHYAASDPTAPYRWDMCTGQYGFPFRGWQPLNPEDVTLPHFYGWASWKAIMPLRVESARSRRRMSAILYRAAEGCSPFEMMLDSGSPSPRNTRPSSYPTEKMRRGAGAGSRGSILGLRSKRIPKALAISMANTTGHKIWPEALARIERGCSCQDGAHRRMGDERFND